MRIVVTGAGGFIGSHLATALKAAGHWVRGADVKYPEFNTPAFDDFVLGDLRDHTVAVEAVRGADQVYALAADMGGMGYIGANGATILENNLLINLNTLRAARSRSVGRVLFSSSACVYPESRQTVAASEALTEAEAYPAEPDTLYGWEKLTTERLCEGYQSEGWLDTRVVRFHNIYGPMGTWEGGREKAPAALCRKVAEAKKAGSHTIEVWGDGEQRRSFCFVADCVEGLQRLMASDYPGPVNLGSDRSVSINELAEIVAKAANWPVKIKHVQGTQGVRGRNSDNSLCQQVLGWVPSVQLEDGIKATYEWIEGQVCG